MCGLSHQGMDHQVGRVGFDDLGRLGFADDMALDTESQRSVIEYGEN